MLYLPERMPAASRLATATYQLQAWRETAANCRVGLLNLMPTKPDTEYDIANMLHTAKGHGDLQLLPLKIKGQTYKTTPMIHMEACYVDFEQIEELGSIDRLIVTGAPLEQMPFEEVRYWTQLCHIMEWADRHAGRTLYICWGAQAALYHFYGINKHPLGAKCFGIFNQQVMRPSSPLMQGLSPAFPMPNSRHTTVRRGDIEACEPRGLHLVAASDDSGVAIAATDDCRRTFVMGHMEYEPLTLDKEYHRDLTKNLPIHAPEHYYDGQGRVIYAWETAARRFYANWVGTDRAH